LLNYADEELSGMACDARFWVLDASDGVKFSQHIIVSMAGPTPYVGDVTQVGRVVKRIAARGCIEMPSIFCVCTHGHKDKCIIDTAVYARNQQFRVMFSSKLGQKRPLIACNRPCPILQDCPWQLFAETLVTAGRASHVRTTRVTRGTGAAHQTTSHLQHTVVYQLLEERINVLLEDGLLQAASVHRTSPLGWPLLYYSTTSRHCPVLHQQHNSNHVQVVVDVLACKWRVWCLDPDCIGTAATWHSFDATLVEVLHPAASRLTAWHMHWARARATRR
jgi:hypothetical protein